MKLVTFAIPCYNSESYMRHCIESILKAKKEIEIIIIDDGSKDNTGKVADDYEEKYPNIVKVIHQENGGHGQGVNQGLKYATGLYYKVVDSDDWVDEKALNDLLDKIEQLHNQNQNVDAILFNYVYEREGKQKVINYKSVFPENQIFTWNDTRRFKLQQNILMHSVCYHTKFLKSTGVQLPKHTFYVDNIFVYYPLSKVKTMYYMNIDFYRYFIGRDDQSVNEQTMIKRIDQQIFVTKTLMDYRDPYSYDNKKLTRYLIHYLSMMMSVTSILLLVSNTSENLEKRTQLWKELQQKNQRLYKKIRYRSLATLTMLPRFIAIPCYRIVRKIFKFN